MTQHVKAQNWLAVVLDFLIVVAGILIAFQITNWNEARKDRIEAVAILDRLEDDFVRLDALTHRSLDSHAASLAATARIINGIVEGRLDGDGLAGDISQSTRGSTPPGPSTTFQELKSNGRIALIKDVELRSRLSEYDDYATLVRQEFRIFEGPVTALRHKFMDVRKLDITGVPSQNFEDLGATRSVDANLILEHAEFLSILQTAYITHDNAHVVYAGMQDRIDDILALIREQKDAAR
ncbi:MAG: hypothetical protein KJ587_06370 [Alphaproteobacteria bacterium]|nr:hypothetical protein [Alphaproteobacteria bacterium]